MLDRIAIAASPLRVIGVALALWLGAHVDLLASAIPRPAATDSMRASKACIEAAPDDNGPRNRLRTRTPGLHHRFLTRDVVAPPALRQYPQ